MSVEDYLAEPVFAKREIAGNAPECTVQLSNGTDLAAVPSSVSAVTLYDLKHLDELARFKKIRYFGTSKVNGPLVQLLSKSKSIEIVHISNCSKELPEFDTRAKYFSFYGCSKLNDLSPIRSLSILTDQIKVSGTEMTLQAFLVSRLRRLVVDYSPNLLAVAEKT